MNTLTSDPKQTMTLEQANKELQDLKDSIACYPVNTKGRAGLLRDVQRAMAFLNTYKCEGTLNSLMVRERQRDYEGFMKSANNKENAK